jgi:hypothetical protein
MSLWVAIVIVLVFIIIVLWLVVFSKKKCETVKDCASSPDSESILYAHQNYKCIENICKKNKKLIM